MNDSIELSRLRITGPINGQTPACVIYEIADSFGIVDPDCSHIEDVISTIRKMKVPRAYPSGSEPHGYTKESLSLISLFVNREVRWTSTRLMRAFSHLISFFSPEAPELPPPGEWVAGRKTLDEPLSYDGCILYKICRYYGVKTSRDTSINDMALSVSLLGESTPALRDKLAKSIPGMSRGHLVSLIIGASVAPSPNIPGTPRPRTYPEPPSSNTPAPISVLESDRLVEVYESLHRGDIILRVTPRTQYEAIMFAAVGFNIDLTDCSDPYREYIEMQKMSMGRTGSSAYVPVDDDFRALFQRNPDFYNVRRTWNPLLNPIYTPEELEVLCVNEGFTMDEIRESGPSQLLHLARITPTFHLGVHPRCTFDGSVISGDPIEGMDSNLVISYGVLDAPPYPMTVSDWADFFGSIRGFVNPAVPSERIEARAIRKLKMIATRLVANSVYTHDYSRLLEGLAAAELTDVSLVEYRERFVRLQGREYVSRGLELLAEIGYYMRGWKVSSAPYPIKSFECTYDYSRQGEVYHNVTQAILRFEEYLKAHPHLHKMFLDMPLVTVHHGVDSLSYVVSPPNTQGFTVGERLEIVKEGDDGDNVNSCIRLTSNYLMITYHYFLTAIGGIPRFAVGDLSFTS